MENIRTMYFDLPNTIGGFTVLTPDGWFTICLNQNLSHERNLISYEHEMNHIIDKDFEKILKADCIEAISHM